jgi:xylulokinase
MDCFLGIDLGAGSLKASLIRRDGRCMASASSPVPTMRPFPGASEQHPQDWWTALRDAVRRVLEQAGQPTVAAVALSAGAHSSVLSDASGRVIRPAIMWNDQRSRAQVDRLKQTAGARIAALSGNSVSPTWTLPHLAWLAENEPRTIAAAQRLTPAKDWLRGQLTGDWLTEPVDAAGLMLFDPVAKTWSEELAELAGISTAILPPLVRSLSIAGHVTARAAAETGLLAGTPVIVGVSDTASEALGAGMTEAGMGVVKLATAATLSCVATAPEPSQVLVSYPYLPEGEWFWITGTNSCASAHAWLREIMFSNGGGAPLDYDAMEAAAASVRPGSNGLYFHPYLNGERAPYWDADLRGSFTGMTFQHGPGHFVRAFYEGIAYSLADIMRQFSDAGVRLRRLRITGGGARSPMWRQILADVLDARIELPETADASFGCALVAGLGIGAYTSMADLQTSIRIVASHDPDPANAAVYREGFDTYRDIHAALRDINHRVSARERN